MTLYRITFSRREYLEAEVELDRPADNYTEEELLAIVDNADSDYTGSEAPDQIIDTEPIEEPTCP